MDTIDTSATSGLSLSDGTDDSDWDTDIEDDGDTVSNTFDPVQDIRDKYLVACIECGVIPVSYFIRNLPHIRINLAHHGIGDLGMKAIAISLMSDTHLAGLNLCDNGLHDEGIEYLCELLRENYYITEIDVSENTNISSEGVLQLCRVLSQTDTIKRLSLGGNKLDDKSAVLISEMFKQNTSLRLLDLSHNDFAEESGLHFGPGLAMNEYLVELNLSWANLRGKGAFAVAKSLQDNISLKKLDVSWNGFGDDGVYVLSEALKVNGSLEHLDVSCNRVTHVGAGHLQKALKENEGLVVLKVGKNPLQHGTASILRGMKENPQSTVKELDLSDVQVNSEFVELLHEVHAIDPSIVVYHAGFSGASCKPAQRPKPMKVLRNHIKKNQLRIFDVFNNLDKDKSMCISVKEFAEGLVLCGVPLRHDELLELVRSLDLNGDGEVSYKELVVGNKEMVKEDRAELKKIKAIEDRNKKLAKDLKPSRPTTPLHGQGSPRNTTGSRPGTGARSKSPRSPRLGSPRSPRVESRAGTGGVGSIISGNASRSGSAAVSKPGSSLSVDASYVSRTSRPMSSNSVRFADNEHEGGDSVVGVDSRPTSMAALGDDLAVS